jgi:cell division protease FtsH
VHRISIIPRGKALGYTLNLPEEDRYLKSKEELLDYMVVLLGGRVTEHIVFGQITTGASDDLRKVHDISRSMVTQYGMGTELASKQLPADDYSMSDHTRRMIDEEQQYLTDLAHRRAMRMIAENRPLLDTLADTLLENEVLEREDITRLVAEYRDGDPSGNGGEPKDRFPVVPIAEPGAAQVAASKRLEDQPSGD